MLTPPVDAVVGLCAAIREEHALPMQEMASLIPGACERHVHRFEREGHWPLDADAYVAAYARLDGVDPAELWRDALLLCRRMPLL